MVWALWAAVAVWLLCTVAAAGISVLRGYTASFGLLLGIVSAVVPVPLLAPIGAVLLTERWTRDAPREPMHPIRWPSRP